MDNQYKSILYLNKWGGRKTPDTAISLGVYYFKKKHINGALEKIQYKQKIPHCTYVAI